MSSKKKLNHTRDIFKRKIGKNNIKKLANAYFSIMILVAAMGLIALCLGVGTYISGLVEKPENTIQISNLLAMIIFYPLSFSGAALVCAYLSRPRGEEKQEYKFFDALKRFSG